MKLNNRGQATSEYAIVIGLIAIACVAGLAAFGLTMRGTFSNIAQQSAPGSPITAMLGGPASGGGSSGSGSSASSSSSLHGPATSVPSGGGKVCFQSGQCANVSVSAYNPAQTVGANGINIVDTYADKIKQLADLAHADPKVNPDFAAMLDDLAADGHNVAGDERSVLTWSASEGGMSFDIQNRYATTKARAMDYLSAHPSELTPEVAAILHTAANNITQQASDFAGGSNISSLNANNINQKFTDAGGSQGATYVDGNASVVCASGGSNCSKKP